MHLRRFENLSKIKNTLELAQPRLAKSITEFDTDPMLFAAGNTWIDLKTGQPVTPKANTLVSLECTRPSMTPKRSALCLRAF